jgi:NAD(P)-dependent dehydrogenase (short-subunit alcohol dehydrogenase family)
MASLSGRVIAVTGAGRGIGHAIVQRLITLGVHVAALDLTLGSAAPHKASSKLTRYWNSIAM